MDKNAIKKYAVWARRELIERVSQKALQYGISADDKADPNVDSVNGRILSAVEKKQRQALIRKIQEQGYEQVMEEVAYTWFNRFAALRFMEVNGYLPSHVRVFTNEDGEFKPQILSEAIHLDIDGLNMDKIYELKNSNKNEELFKYLLIVQCNALSSILPRMFQKIEDYTELLLPDNLLREGSVIEQMVNQRDGIPESDWTDQVQIIGWLYQYYNIEPKAKVFSRPNSKKIDKSEIPAATQLFTPDWIVHYMVENSLGRLWLEGHPNDVLKSEWKYYLEEAEQEADVRAQLGTIRKEYAALKPEEIRCIDPCMGSGHILCVLFDTLVRIYEDYGYSAREAAASIVENNLWGLDIDERAVQLSYFAVMMKACQYDRRFFSHGIQPHVYVIEESNGLRYDGDYGDFLVDKTQQETLNYMLDVFKDAKEYGSILNIEQKDYEGFLKAWGLTAEQSVTDLRMFGWYMIAGEKIISLANQAKALSQKYHVVVTNPPYMGADGMDVKLLAYVKKKFAICKADMYAVFIKQCNSLLADNGFQAMITQHSWMFLSSFDKLRQDIIQNMTIINMAHLGARAFEEISGEVVQTVTWIMKKKSLDYCGVYARLVEPTTQDAKEALYLSHSALYYSKQKFFESIPNMPVAYWISPNFRKLFENGDRITEYVSSRDGLTTGNNDLFIRYFWEIPNTSICFGSKDAEMFWKTGKKYAPLIKGGLYRKWYGNNWFVITYDKTGYSRLSQSGNKLPSREIYFYPYISWNRISTRMAFRYCEKGYLFESASLIAFSPSRDSMMLALSFANSVLAKNEMQLINPTTNMLSGYVDSLSVPALDDKEKKRCIDLAEECVALVKKDWDESETSWDFSVHPLIGKGRLFDLLDDWDKYCERRFDKIQKNEKEINDIYLTASCLSDEFISDVDENSISVKKADAVRDIKSLLSYAVGCMFGRYSLDVPGLVYAGGEWDASKYTTYQPDKDAIIPICDDEYFEDDIVGRFVKFIEVVYGKETLEENLQFIAQALGGKGTFREIIRNYFINDFYSDHVKIYQKRPIYWLFDSGKKNGFKCLVYMHRYQPDTIARIRTDYVHEQQSRYRTAIADLEQRINGASTSERVKLNKQLSTLQAQAEEIRIYEEKIHHLADQMIRIDLDDGVKHNYEIFKDVLAKIK